jgi:hypothetical protein
MDVMSLSMIRKIRFNNLSIKYLIVGLMLVHLIPIWAFKFIPTQDGINHVYNAYILKEYNNPQYTQFRQVYELNIKPFPNWTSHAFFFVALYIMPPLIAEKVFVTICVLLVPLSFFYFYNSVDKRLWFFGFLGFLYSYNLLLHLGFYSFSLSVPLYFFLLGYWWKHRENLGWKHGLIVNALLIFLYFSHLFSFALAILSISLLSFTSSILVWDEAKSIKNRLWMFLRSVLWLIPSYIILLLNILLNPEEKTATYTSLKELWKFFVSVKSLVYYNDRYIIISQILLGFMGLCFLLTLGIILWSIFKKKEKIRRVFFNQRFGFLVLFGVITALFFKIPWSYGPPAWLNDRVNLFILPVLTAWFAFSYPKWIKAGMVVCIILLSLAHLSLTIYDYNLLNKDMKEFTSGAELIKDDSSISILTNDYYFAPNHGTIKYLSPFLHDTCYYCFGNGSHYVANYEPKYAYFPLQYKEGYWKFEYKGTIDYILVWHMDDNSPEVTKLKADYDLIHSTENMRLFRHKSTLKKDISN